MTNTERGLWTMQLILMLAVIFLLVWQIGEVEQRVTELENPGPLVIDSNTTVVLQREYFDNGTGEWVAIGEPYETPFWAFNNESAEIMDVRGRVTDLEDIGLYVIDNPVARDALEQHGIGEEAITDLYLKLSER